jgi:hypothetical protein
MPNHPPSTKSGSAASSTDSLTDRVAARVIDARLAIERRASGSHSSPRGRKPVSPAGGGDSAAAGEQRETQSLRRVFRDLGVSYRRYRSQTGKPVVPELREAAYRFRADPSLASLVAVAAYLDELDLLS